MAKQPTPPFIGTDNYYPGGNTPIRRIVLHCTVSPCEHGGARNIAGYFRTGTDQASAHYIVDPGEVIQCVHDWDVAWHDGTNSHSLGVELCCTLADEGHEHWDRANHRRMLDHAADLVAQLCAAYDVPARKIGPAQIRDGQKGICGHDDMRDAYPGSTSHWDPGPHFPWGSFINLVTGEDDDDVNDQDKRDIAKMTVDEWEHRRHQPFPPDEGSSEDGMRENLHFLRGAYSNAMSAEAEAREDRVSRGAPERTDVWQKLGELETKLDRVLDAL